MSDKGPHDKKCTSRERTLSIGHLDRTSGFKHEHYGHREVAAANHAVEGQRHE